ncbi:hypothetical protein [Listeria sp. ILCC797]|uniref:hypothetical protein n=1 Tax=Listeria sp. ILCC797 TaxID=1918333 RepID=UPI000B592266|nr:hypothetical protein [Listeria sp. ILCC797]
MKKVNGYVLSNQKHNGSWAYEGQSAITESGKYVLLKQMICIDNMTGEVTETWFEEVENYIVDERRENELLKNGYHGKDVTYL